MVQQGMLGRLVSAVACFFAGHGWKFLRFGARHKPQFSTTAHTDCDCIDAPAEHRQRLRELAVPGGWPRIRDYAAAHGMEAYVRERPRGQAEIVMHEPPLQTYFVAE